MCSRLVQRGGQIRNTLDHHGCPSTEQDTINKSQEVEWTLGTTRQVLNRQLFSSGQDLQVVIVFIHLHAYCHCHCILSSITCAFLVCGRVDSRNNSSSPQPSIVFKRAGLAGLDTVCYAMPMIMLTYANDNSTDPSFWAYIVDLGTVTDGHDCEIYRCDGLREGIHWWGHLSFVAYLPF